MSEGTIEITGGTRNQLTARYDYQKVFIFDNRFESAIISNATGSDLVLPIGRVLGRISAVGATQGQVTPHASGSTDGSQIPVGILAEDITLADGASATVSFCVFGEVNENAIQLDSGDNLDTTFIDGRSIRDRIAGDTVGIVLRPTVENTRFNN